MLTRTFIYGVEARPGRAQRIAQSNATHVVIVEREDGSYVELDASDREHAERLCKVWILPMYCGSKSNSAAIWEVNHKGALIGADRGKPLVIRDWRDYQEEAA